MPNTIAAQMRLRIQEFKALLRVNCELKSVVQVIAIPYKLPDCGPAYTVGALRKTKIKFSG